MTATPSPTTEPSGIAFSREEHQAVSRHWRTWRRFGVAVRIAGDHAGFEEMIEISPHGTESDMRWNVYLTPEQIVYVDDLDGDPLEFPALEAALTFIGAEIEADTLARAGEDPCGLPL